VGRSLTFKYRDPSWICLRAWLFDWPTVQTPTESALFTTYWQQTYTNPESHIIHLFSLYTTQKESSCCYCSYLPVTSTPCTSQLHGPSWNYPRLTYQQYYPRVLAQWLRFTTKRIWNYFTNLLTAVASCMCIAQRRSNLPIENTNSSSSVGSQCSR
jgi:hypothetical protein